MSWSILCSKLIPNKRRGSCLQQIRNLRRGIKSPILGLPPDEHPTFSQILKYLNREDPAICYKVDIGLPPSQLNRKYIKKSLSGEKPNYTDDELFEKIMNEWASSDGSWHFKKAAEHYGIFNDLFGDAYFIPFTRMEIAYKLAEEQYVPVYRGNIVKPHEALSKPEVTFNADPDTFYTLVLSNPDGHLCKENSEYVHWMVANIPDGDMSKGEEIIKYLQPFPTKGTGYHRYVYVLYKQNKKLDYNDLKFSDADRIDLEKRTFSSYSFYRPRQEDITPVGLAFFQTDWDSSVNEFFHKKLNIEEPIFEYDTPPPVINKQEWIPRKEPFNTYLDKYRDPKQIAKELLLKRLKTLHPFKKPDPPPKYPAAHTLYDSKDAPSWLFVERKKERLGWGVQNDHKDMLDPK